LNTGLARRRLARHGRRACLPLLLATIATAAVSPARPVRFSEVRPILVELAGQLSAELNALTVAQLEAVWPAWIERRNREIRGRLDQGDEDTLVNWLLFGTSFTSKPRAVLGAVDVGGPADREQVLRRTIELISARLDDLLTALATPGTDERRRFARAHLQRHGLRFTTAADREAVRQHLLAAVVRVGTEQEQIDQELGVTAASDPLEEFVRRSRLFRTRGLSLDTSLVSNYSVEQSLVQMKARGAIGSGSLKRVAIVGPGLDVADKDIGFDFYAPQTLQPFALIDAIERLGLAAAPGGPEVVLLDISPRLIDHVARAQARAAKNIGYTLTLPLATGTPWLPELRAYWQTFGDRIGTPSQASVPKAIGDLAQVRTVRARPSAVRRLSVRDVNIVTDRLGGDAFDLIVATNVLIYYDRLEQAMAMSNIEAMLKPGAFLLANVSAPGLQSIALRPVETTTTIYTRTASESVRDFVVWYQRP
jgi:SAM-dependent methyltransferase